MATNKKNISFEEALQSLETAVENLESGNLTLDASLKEFEEAVRLVKICGDKLENAKQKVNILIKAEDGSVSDAPFTEENED